MRITTHLAWLAVTLTCSVAAARWGQSVPLLATPAPVDPYITLAEAHRAEDAITVRQAALEGLRDPRTRADAANVLSWVGTSEDAELLWTLALDRDEQVADTAVRGLGRIGGEESMQRLIRLSADREASTRDMALVALGDIEHSDAIGTLRNALSDPMVNHAAAQGLARNGSTRAAVAVTTAFWSSNGWDTDSFAHALTAFPVEAGARATLWQAVDQERPPWFEEALDALADANDPALYDRAIGLLDSPSSDTRAAAVSALEELDDRRAIPALLRLLDRADGNELSSVVSALQALGGREVEDALVERMESAPPEIARAIADWMFSPPTPEDAQTMVRIVRARPGVVAKNLMYTLFSHDWPPGRVPRVVLELAREYAAITAQQDYSYVLSVLVLGQVQADMALVEDLVFTGTRAQRQLAMDALDDDPSRERDALFLALLDDADPTIVEAAIAALDERGPEAQAAMVERLIANLGRHPAGTAWGGAEDLLARVGGERGRSALLDQVRTGTGTERDNAIDALINSDTAAHHRALYDALESLDPDARRRVLETSLGSGNAPRDAILRGLDDEDDDVVRAAARALGEADGPGAAAKLRALLDDDSREEDLRDDLLDTLVSAGPPDIEDTLNGLLDDAFLAEAALSHLGDLGTDDANRTLRSVALDHEDPEMRTAALSTLAYGGAIPDELDVYLRALDDEDTDVRETAIDGIESLGTSQAAAKLLAIVQGDGPDAADAASALESLGGALATENAELLTEVQLDADDVDPSTPVDSGGGGAP